MACFSIATHSDAHGYAEQENVVGPDDDDDDESEDGDKHTAILAASEEP